MVDRVDAVIAALQIALEEAERSSSYMWKVRNANRWIDQLPGSFFRWRHLKLSGDDAGQAPRLEFIGHVRATLAYLATNQEEIASMRSWSWRLPKLWAAKSTHPVDVEFQEVSGNDVKKLPKPSKPMRVVR
jgi:hypothetical protein